MYTDISEERITSIIKVGNQSRKFRNPVVMSILDVQLHLGRKYYLYLRGKKESRVSKQNYFAVLAETLITIGLVNDSSKLHKTVNESRAQIAHKYILMRATNLHSSVSDQQP
jgi:hypothetical protein